MGFYLLDHPNPHGPHFYRSRSKPLLAVVVHVTASVQDQDFRGADSSAENTARYAATTNRAVSWHSASDSDSHFQLLPDSYTAYQCQGYNSCTAGHEISKRDVSWADEPARWVTATLEQTAASLKRFNAMGVPLRRTTKAEVDRALATGASAPLGYIGHSELDPARRRDPGPDFPWDRLFAMMAPVPTTPPPLPKEHSVAALITEDRQKVYGFDGVRVWHVPRPDVLEAVKATGVYGDNKIHVVPAGTIASLLAQEV